MINKSEVTPKMIYNIISPEEATNQMNQLQYMLDAFLDKSCLNRADIEYNDAILMKIVVRIDQRSDYFMYFHSTVDSSGNVDIDEMSQYKQIALLCFWILKYKPLRIADCKRDFEYYIQNGCTINETFAAYIFISQINSSKLLNKKQKKYYMSKAYVSDLFYKFMQHDISKEAMIFSLCSVVCSK